MRVLYGALHRLTRIIVAMDLPDQDSRPTERNVLLAIARAQRALHQVGARRTASSTDFEGSTS